MTCGPKSDIDFCIANRHWLPFFANGSLFPLKGNLGPSDEHKVCFFIEYVKVSFNFFHFYLPNKSWPRDCGRPY